MSATIIVDSGVVRISVEGHDGLFEVPAQLVGIECDIGLGTPIDEIDLPTIGSASEPFNVKAGSATVYASDGEVLLRHYKPKPGSPHPDEAAMEVCEQVNVKLKAGESYSAAMHDDNAHTMMILKA